MHGLADTEGIADRLRPVEGLPVDLDLGEPHHPILLRDVGDADTAVRDGHQLPWSEADKLDVAIADAIRRIGFGREDGERSAVGAESLAGQVFHITSLEWVFS